MKYHRTYSGECLDRLLESVYSTCLYLCNHRPNCNRCPLSDACGEIERICGQAFIADKVEIIVHVNSKEVQQC